VGELPCSSIRNAVLSRRIPAAISSKVVEALNRADLRLLQRSATMLSRAAALMLLLTIVWELKEKFQFDFIGPKSRPWFDRNASWCAWTDALGLTVRIILFRIVTGQVAARRILKSGASQARFRSSIDQTIGGPGYPMERLYSRSAYAAGPDWCSRVTLPACSTCGNVRLLRRVRRWHEQVV